MTALAIIGCLVAGQVIASISVLLLAIHRARQRGWLDQEPRS